jgi:hypothetical protein
MATDRAIAQAFREACDAADADHATLRDMQRWVNHRAAELDATPPAGAGEAVAWMLRWTGVFTEEGKSHFYTDKKAADRMAETVRDSYGCPDVEVTPLYAAPTPLPEAVETAWTDAFGHTNPAGYEKFRTALRALTGGDKQGEPR